ncbi:MAG: hypothetical protein VX498_04975 [Myxococcota bacterium]|nr:hypothetical protein [Myxococcota bacterium]
MALRPLFPLAISLVLSFALLSACSVGDDDDDDDSVPGDDDDSTPYVQPGPWEDLDFGQRLEFMTELVEPRMKELFVAFDDEEYAYFGCETCHGDDADDVDYEMPNGGTALDVDDFPLQQSPDERLRAYAVFMNDEVKPIMAEMLELLPHPQGPFGCFECHEQD